MHIPLIPLTPKQKVIHERAVRLSRRHRVLEAELIQCLCDVETSKLYKNFNCRSLTAYAIKMLELSEPVAGAFVTVANKSMKVAKLAQAIADHKISVSKASRICSAITNANAAELIDFAMDHTTVEIDREAARLNPKHKTKDSVRSVDGKSVKMHVTLSNEVHADFKRAQSVMAQKQKGTDFESVLGFALKEFLDHHDPVRKAERWQARREKRAAAGKASSAQAQTRSQSQAQETAPAHNEDHIQVYTQDQIPAATLDQTQDHGQTQTSTQSVKPVTKTIIHPETTEMELPLVGPESTKSRESRLNSVGSFHRIPLTAETRHQVFLRDQGRCTHAGLDGKRCGSDRYTDTHHIIPIHMGGTNELSNLTLLCSFHHDLVHQMSFPLEGAVSWLRSPEGAYLN